MAEELVNNQEQQTNESRALFALTKKSNGAKQLVASLSGIGSGYTIDGIYLTDGTHAFIMSLTEMQRPFGGCDSADLTEGDELYNVASPAMSSFDGDWRSAFIKQFYNLEAGTAVVDAEAYGHLPAGGEMALIATLKDQANTLLQEAGGDALGDGYYWTSQKYSNQRMWSCSMADGKFTLNNGNVSPLSVRPIAPATGYAEV